MVVLTFFFDSAGFAGAFVDRIVETKGVSQVFFSLFHLTIDLVTRAHLHHHHHTNVQRWTSLIKRRRRELRMTIMLPISLLGIIKLVDPCCLKGRGAVNKEICRNVNC